MKNKKIKGNIMLLLTAFIWGVAFIAQSIGAETLSACTFNGTRSVLGALGLIPVIMILDSKKKSSAHTYRFRIKHSSSADLYADCSSAPLPRCKRRRLHTPARVRRDF